MTNVDKIRAHVDGLNNKAIASSKEHGKLLVAATVASFLFMTVHGQPGPLNHLFKNVNTTDQEGIRLFAFNIISTFAKDKSAKNAFFTYSKANGFTLAAIGEDEPERLAASKEMKKTIEAAGDAGLSKIPMGKMENQRDTLEDAFNTAAKVQNFIKSLARNGEKSLALAINRVVGNDYALEVGIVDQIAAENDPAAKLKAAQAKVEALKAQVERSTKNADKAEPAKVAA